MKQLSDYKLLEKNPFPAKEGGIERTAANIKRLPKMLEFRPIIVDSNNIIQAGNKRFQALLLLGYKEVQDNWIKEAKDYTAHELKELVLLDNVDEGVWDLEILELEYPDIDIEDLGIIIDDVEIDNIDYSDKNQEIDTDDFSDKMTLKLEFDENEYSFINSELSKLDANKETALLKLLKYEP